MPQNERILFFRNSRNLNPGSSREVGLSYYYRQLLQVFTLVVF